MAFFLASCFTLTRFGDGGMVVDGRNRRTSGAGFSFCLPFYWVIRWRTNQQWNSIVELEVSHGS